MAEKDSPFSMFSSSAKAKKKAAPPPHAPAPQVEQPPSAPAPTAPAAPVENGSEFKTVKEMLDKAKQFRDDLTRKLDQVQSITGWDIQGMDSYLSNPGNFKPAEWEMVKLRKAALENKFYQLLGTTEGGAQGARVQVKKAEKEKTGKERKGKTLGGRKGWIPMR